MARIRGLGKHTVAAMTVRCPECDEDVNDFLSLLREADSLSPDPFADFGITLVREEHLQAPDCTYRRCRTYELPCKKKLTFYWKKAVVDRFLVDC